MLRPDEDGAQLRRTTQGIPVLMTCAWQELAFHSTHSRSDDYVPRVTSVDGIGCIRRMVHTSLHVC